MRCTICGDRRACLACRGEGHLRWRVDNDPEFRALIERRWREAPPVAGAGAVEATPAYIDPIALAIDLCPHRRSCQCRPPIRCDLTGEGRLVALDECRACKAAQPVD